MRSSENKSFAVLGAAGATLIGSGVYLGLLVGGRSH